MNSNEDNDNGNTLSTNYNLDNYSDYVIPSQLKFLPTNTSALNSENQNELFERINDEILNSDVNSGFNLNMIDSVLGENDIGGSNERDTDLVRIPNRQHDYQDDGDNGELLREKLKNELRSKRVKREIENVVTISEDVHLSVVNSNTNRHERDYYFLKDCHDVIRRLDHSLQEI